LSRSREAFWAEDSFASLLHLSDNLAACEGDSAGMKERNIARNLLGLIVAVILSSAGGYAQTHNIPNRLIDYDGFLTNASKVALLRNERRISEDQFIRMAQEPGTIVFDARSDDKYKGLHIKGARHLSFPEITEAELAKVFPSKGTRILIYCNNNFLNAPNTLASKAPAASLNIHTFNTLYSYGYTNVYELGPLIDIKKTKLQFEGMQIKAP
jgi:hypothetical protein